jgi:hypothetical protein
MNLLSEYKLKMSSGEFLLRLTNKALYRAQVDLGKKGLMELITSLDAIDLVTIYTMIVHCSDKKLTVDQLLDEDIDLLDLSKFLSESIVVLFQGKKTQPVLETKGHQ